MSKTPQFREWLSKRLGPRLTDEIAAEAAAIWERSDAIERALAADIHELYYDKGIGAGELAGQLVARGWCKR